MSLAIANEARKLLSSKWWIHCALIGLKDPRSNEPTHAPVSQRMMGRLVQERLEEPPCKHLVQIRNTLNLTPAQTARFKPQRTVSCDTECWVGSSVSWRKCGELTGRLHSGSTVYPSKISFLTTEVFWHWELCESVMNLYVCGGGTGTLSCLEVHTPFSKSFLVESPSDRKHVS